jgi:hypothetical protein
MNDPATGRASGKFSFFVGGWEAEKLCWIQLLGREASDEVS